MTVNKKLILVAILGIFIIFKPPIDPDFGWHYKYGEYMVQNRRFLRENIYSYNMADYSWANSYTIPQIIMYISYANLGPIGMGLIFSLFLAGSTIFILKGGIKKDWLVITGNLLLFLFFNHYTVSVRPLLFSTVFMLLLVKTLLYRPEHIKWLPLLFLIWVNTHADYTLGLFVLGIYNIQTLLTKGLRKEYLVQYGASLACIPITLINPYGMGLWETLFKETNSISFKHIMECLPIQNREFLPIYTGTAALIIASFVGLKNKKPKTWLALVTFFFFGLSLRLSYLGRVFILTGIFLLLEFLQQEAEEIDLKDLLGGKNLRKIKKAGILCLAAIFITTEVIFVKNLKTAGSQKNWAEEYEYPYEAVQLIKKFRPEGKMFNYYTWGGYLIWQLPEYKTFIDGRMPSWREDEYSVFQDYIDIVREPEEHYSLLVKYDPGWIIVPTKSELGNYLQKAHPQKWRIIFQDDTAEIYQIENATTSK